MIPAAPLPLELHARFVFPFSVPRERVAEASAALGAAAVARLPQAWASGPPHQLSADELLPHVAAYVFPAEGAPGCATLRLGEPACNRIFRGLRAGLRGVEAGVALSRPAGVELVISTDGAGLLSVALQLEAERLDADLALWFANLGAGRHRRMRLELSIPDRRGDPSIPEAHRQRMEPPPPPDAPVEARLGAAGGAFTLEELARSLASPLQPLGLAWHNATPTGAPIPFVYSVLRFGPEVDFDEAAARDALAPLGAALAQLEEPLHAGAMAGDLGLPAAYLNRKHLALVGPMGAAHLVADQAARAGAAAPEFNHERVQRVLLKYFVPTQLALLQRSTLQQAAAQVAALAVTDLAQDSARRRELQRLRHQLVEFAARGQFPQVSTRHALHRAYELTRRGLAVEALWEDVRRAVQELDAAHGARDQHQLTLDMARSLEDGNRMQAMVHVIEVFLVSVYSAHLALMLFETVVPIFKGNERVEHPLHLSGPFLVAGAALCGFILARRLVSHGHRGH